MLGGLARKSAIVGVLGGAVIATGIAVSPPAGACGYSDGNVIVVVVCPAPPPPPPPCGCQIGYGYGGFQGMPYGGPWNYDGPNMYAGFGGPGWG